MKTKTFISKMPVLMIFFMLLTVSIKAQSKDTLRQKPVGHQKHSTKSHPVAATTNASDSTPVHLKNNDRTIKDSILKNYKF